MPCSLSHAKCLTRPDFQTVLHSRLSQLRIVGVGCTLLFAAVVGVVRADDSHTMGPRTVEVVRDRYAQVWHVAQGPGSDAEGEGSDAKPWRTLAHALSHSQNAADDNRIAILVSAGAYEVSGLITKEYVDLFGGFDAGNWKRDILSYATVLDAGKRGRALVASDRITIDGFIITRGSLREAGGALLCDATSPTVTNNRFVNNHTRKPRDWKPAQIHELANDGGAVCCLHGASPVISHNIFADNQTEAGRGGAISLRDRCGGEISHNVFLANHTGTDDEYRSSDGGAVSVFDWSHPQIYDNVFVENKALNQNDGGAIFVALWSSPVVKKNVFAGNRSGDDGGALFVGGQEHRYGRPYDPVPSQDEFQVEVSENTFVGNESEMHDSGGMRLAMEARVKLTNNVLARDARLYIQDSNVDIINNTFTEDIIFKEMANKAGQSVIVNNIFLGQFRAARKKTLKDSEVRFGFADYDNFKDEPRFIQDQRRLPIESATYVPQQYITKVKLSDRVTPHEFVNRVIRVDNFWTVAKDNKENELTAWGNIAGRQELQLLPTFQLMPESPCVDRGSADHAPLTDIYGDPRPWGKAVDIGADEFLQTNPTSE